MDKREQNMKWLLEYQEDLIKIVGKHRKSGHVLSVEEIISEINNHVISKGIINKDYSNKVDFCKFLYGIAKNWVRWTATGVKHKDKDFNLKRYDTIKKTDEGEMTAFEFICATIGAEDNSFQELNSCNRFENIYKWIFDYSHFLSEKQKNVLPYIMLGKTLDEIGDAMGVTHQAVSALVLDAFARIRQHVKIDITQDNDQEIISKGQNSINYLFGPSRKEYRSQFNTSLKRKNLSE